MTTIQENFVIEMLDEQYLNDFFVYKIWLGPFFYVGSTTQPLNRLLSHTKAINLSMNYGCRYGKNAITNMANLLLANPHIKTGLLEVIETCISEVELVEVEYKHLVEVYGSPFCLNESKSTTRRIGDELYRPSKLYEYPMERDSQVKKVTQDLVFIKKLRKSLSNLGIG